MSNSDDPTALACRLSDADQAARREQLAEELFSGIRDARELEDGFAFRFPGEGPWAEQITTFVLFERTCCPFLRFELTFEPEEGPIRLVLRGEERVKEFLRELLPETGLSN